MLAIMQTDRGSDSPASSRLLATSVADLLACDVQVLEVLVTNGFTHLENPAMRWALAPTVTLGQARRIRPLAAEQRAALLSRLEVLCPGT